MLYIHPFTGDGSTKLYSIPSRIINERHVEVYVNVTGGTITNSNLLPAENYDIAFNSIIFKDAPIKGATIQVRTATNPDELLEPLTDLQAVAASLAQIQEVADNLPNIFTAVSESLNNAQAASLSASQADAAADSAALSATSAADSASKALAVVGGNLEIDMLADVTINTPIDGQVLTYDSGTGEWSNKPISISLNDIQDVEANGTVQDGDILRYNATTQRYELYKLSQLLENVDMGYIS